MYSVIEIEGFRGLSHLKISDLAQINLLVGKNNCGKTSVLEALFLLTGGTNSRLPLSINDFRHITQAEDYWLTFFHYFNAIQPLRIRGRLRRPSEERELTIRPHYEDYKKISREKDKRPDGGNSSTIGAPGYAGQKQRIDGLCLEFAQKSGGKKKETFSPEIYEDEGGYKLSFPKESIYKESRYGAFLNSEIMHKDVAQRLSDIGVEKRMEDIMKVLRRIEPKINGISIGRDNIIFADIGLNRLVPMSIMGEGTRKVLSVLCAIMHKPNGMIFIDEIENGLYKSAQDAVWQALFGAAQELGVQVFATTHSLECVNAFASCCFENGAYEKMGRLIRIEREADSFKTIIYDRKKIRDSLEMGWEVR